MKDRLTEERKLKMCCPNSNEVLILGIMGRGGGRGK